MASLANRQVTYCGLMVFFPGIVVECNGTLHQFAWYADETPGLQQDS